MSKILITGGLGFVGNNLVRHLLQNGNDKIVVLDNLSTSKYNNRVRSPRVEYVIGSTVDIETKFSDRNFDKVFHFGEYSRIATSFDDIDRVLEYNQTGTANVLKFCVKKNSKLIYSATSSSFGYSDDMNPYSWTKSKNIELIKNFGKWFGLRYEICYFYNVYGPGQIEKGPYSTVVGIFERLKREGKPLTIVSPGTQTRDFTHVSDIVNGVVKASNLERRGEYYLRSGKVVSIINLAAMFGGEVKIVPERRGERFSTLEMRDDDKTREILDWEPKIELNEYVSKLEGKEHVFSDFVI